jgi:hypothetical protein
MRTQHLGLDAPAHAAAGSQPVARISGIQGQNFRNPHRATRSRASAIQLTWRYLRSLRSPSADRRSPSAERGAPSAMRIACRGSPIADHRHVKRASRRRHPIRSGSGTQNRLRKPAGPVGTVVNCAPGRPGDPRAVLQAAGGNHRPTARVRQRARVVVLGGGRIHRPSCVPCRVTQRL